MNANFVTALYELGVIRRATELEVKYIGSDIGGYSTSEVIDYFVVESLLLDPSTNKVSKLKVLRSRDLVPFTINPEQIINIDGMSDKRMGQAFNINTDGSKKAIKLDDFGNPIKRGRKSNKVKEMMKEKEDQEKKKITPKKKATPKKIEPKKKVKPKKTKTKAPNFIKTLGKRVDQSLSILKQVIDKKKKDKKKLKIKTVKPKSKKPISKKKVKILAKKANKKYGKGH